jgi:putative acyl-CoA dehydrogenase
LALQASVLLRAGSPVADAFCRSRLAGNHGLVFGTLPGDAGFSALMARALPD